ncbi:MAG TPA: ATP-dependent DNA ligase [Candidatus Babeliaceae bacterium]|nr:ATP-dependent DNA ligase [Candidatus Babeliaceae bacterium]
MEFKAAAEYFKLIESLTSRIEITRVLALLYSQASADEAQALSYLLMGLVRPSYKGSQFNLAQKSVAKVVASLVGWSLVEVDLRAQEKGDLGLVVLENSRLGEKKLSIMEVYDQLLALEKIEGVGSQERRAQLLLLLLQDVDSISACYLVRIVLGKLRLGFSDMTIIDSLSWMLAGNKSLREPLEHAYNICADLGIIAWTAKQQGIEGIKKLSISIGVPVRLAAAERLPTAQAIIDKLGSCVVQPKLDGFRLQVHVRKLERQIDCWFYSRNLQNMSNIFPEFTRALNKLSVETLIVEGEAIAYDPDADSFVPFQETAKRKRKHDIESVAQELPLRLFLFDLLYLNGESYLDKSEQQRREALLSLYPVAQGEVISTISEQVVDTAQELESYFLFTIESGLEGVIVKKPSSLYQAGKRNFNWIKLKRQEEGHLEDTLDCVVLGYYFGKGKRVSFGIGAFLVGVYDPKLDRFETIAKVGTGLTDEEWKELKRRCDDRRVMERPHNILCATGLEPDIWVSPEIVCSIRADEITLSPLHTAGKTENKAGFALRFPRFIGYSLDKDAFQATTVSEVKSLFINQNVYQI